MPVTMTVTISRPLQQSFMLFDAAPEVEAIILALGRTVLLHRPRLQSEFFVQQSSATHLQYTLTSAQSGQNKKALQAIGQGEHDREFGLAVSK